jgi:arylsulfatase A-like enzyme
VASDVHRAHAGYERRGGLIALTDLSSSIQRGARYASLDMSHPERFHCQPPPPPSAASSRTAADLLGHRNVILISVDTLRKDALQMTDGAGKPVAPNLRKIQAQSLSFERAVTTYPATLFALGSALTGKSPSEVMFAPEQPDNLFTQTRSLFQDMLIALPSVGWFKRPPVPQLLTQTTPPAYFANAERSTSWMLQRLRESRTRRRRVFAWIHYFEPHTSRSLGRGQRAVQTARVSYGDLVHEVDAQIGRLWGNLERLGYLRDSLVIVFSDHGESLGEFGYFGHHVYLNHFATDVPLLVHRPNMQPAKTDAQALLSDIAPTVLSWLGLPAPASGARDLLTLAAEGGERYAMNEAFPVRGRALYDVARMPITSPTALRERMHLLRTAAIDYQPKVSLVSAHYRLIVNQVTGAEEFYDRVRDPGERDDLSQDNLPEYARMRAALATQMRALSERIYCAVQRSAR